MLGIVYKITNLINNKVYIGQTKNSLEKRFSGHCRNRKSAIGLAIKKYGKQNFKIEKICLCATEQEIVHRERLCIRLFNTLSPNGYNLTSGGEIKKQISKETSLKLSRNKKGKPCVAQSLAMLGRKQSISLREKKAKSRGISIFKVINNQSNVEVGKFKSIGLCCEALKLDAAHVSKCLRKIRKSHKGFLFIMEA